MQTAKTAAEWFKDDATRREFNSPPKLSYGVRIELELGSIHEPEMREVAGQIKAVGMWEAGRNARRLFPLLPLG